jgi:transcriptional antiterminator NusG
MDDNLNPEMPEEVQNVDSSETPEVTQSVEETVEVPEVKEDSMDNLFEEETSAEETQSEETEIESVETEVVEEEKLSIDDVVTKDEAEVEEAPVVVKKAKSNKKWYSLRVISGKEKKIKERIELEIQRNKWSEVLTQVLVPSEKVYKIRGGKKVILERNILPGYILVEAVSKSFRGEMITAIANIPNVIHFLGRNHPIPMHQAEANRMLGKVDESQDASAAMIEPFIVGETVKIMDGPFKDFVGDIKDVNEEKKKLKVIVKIFGRGTEVELNFMQVEKQS